MSFLGVLSMQKSNLVCFHLMKTSYWTKTDSKKCFTLVKSDTFCQLDVFFPVLECFPLWKNDTLSNFVPIMGLFSFKMRQSET